MKFPIFVFIITNFFIARMLSTYHDNLIFKKCRNIDNKFFQYILIGSNSSRHKKSDRSKITYQGIIFHILCFILILFCIFFLFIAPQIEEEVLIIGSVRRYHGWSSPLIADTINEAVSFLGCFIVFSLETALLNAESVKSVYNNNTETSTWKLIIDMLLTLLMTISFLALFFISVLRIITLFN